MGDKEKEERDLRKRVHALLRELMRKRDYRFGELVDVLGNVASRDALEKGCEQALYQGCVAVLNYVEEQYPDLYGFLQRE